MLQPPVTNPVHINPGKAAFFSRKRQFKPLLIGLACGLLVMLVSFLTLFNELVITPFIQQGFDGQASVVVDETELAKDTSPKVIIPKIKVDIPVDYALASADESAVEAALDNGIVHYPTSVKPGQSGNAVFFGHSSNNILNRGKYKFAFVLLHKLTPGDLFYVSFDGKLYTYEVIGSRVVHPSEVSVLGPIAGETATATLITCDPPGTSNNRLIVTGRQITPDPAVNIAQAESNAVVIEPMASLPGNGPSLPRRIWETIF